MPEHTDISNQLKKYLDGKLDARAMHELERRAQDDPFLMDALEGYQTTPVDMNAGLSELHNRLQKSTAKKEARIIPWRTIGLAASILILLGLGVFWYENREPSAVQVAHKNIAYAPKAEKPSAPQTPAPYAGASKSSSATDNAAVKPDTRLAVNHAKVRFVPPAVAADAEAVATPPAESNIEPATEAASKPVASTPLDEVAVMDYTEKKKSGDLLKEKSINTLADSTFHPAANAAVAKVKVADSPALREVRIKGTDIAQLDNNTVSQYALSPAPNANMVAKEYFNYQPKSVQANGDISSIISRPTRFTAIKSYMTKRSPGAGGIAPMNPVIVHGKPVKGMVKLLGEPVAYATVKIKGTTISTLTDDKGMFTLYAVPDSAILQVSADGNILKETKVTRRNLQVISLQQTVNPMSETAPVSDNGSADITQPRPSTGWDEFGGYLRQNAISPDGKPGVVKLSFTVNADNSLTDFKIVNGISTPTDNLAIKLVKDGPAWYSSAEDKAQVVTINIKFRAHRK